ncbi:MAG: CDP-glycerol glycerophosphotransferase family protein [Kangiellaceae bacterium]|nr:CDP-glycerol glycerophosphotransferase family protein [Kangiellaceae bacterium]
MKYLLYITQNYSFEILRPLQEEIVARGDECYWFVEGAKVNLENFSSDEKRLNSIDDIKKFSPDAIFVPGNHVPRFVPGLKVQVFHGLEWKKKGHFRIRGFFDLYCTHGELTTTRFKQLEKMHKYFKVVETGWPKLDPLYKTEPFKLESQLPVVLFAPTFSPNLTSAVELFEEIKKLVELGSFHWIVKFHPKMNADWIAPYQKITNKNFTLVKIDSCLPLLQRADVLLSDTSSIISEFLLLDKPAVTFKNKQPGEYLINFTNPVELQRSLELALQGSSSLLEQIKYENKKLHPFTDGQSSIRVLDAVQNALKEGYDSRRKPFNFFRNLKLRRKLSYWR